MQDETFSQMQLDVLQMLDPSFLATISMQELYERIFQRKPPIIDGLLYTGTYLFVGAALYCTSHSKTITAGCRKGFTECSARQDPNGCISPSRQIRSAKD